MPELLLEIQDAKANNNYSKFMQILSKILLLILDDLGHKSYTLEESRDILEIAETRYNKDSMIIAGQVPSSQWYELSPTRQLDAILDRIIQNSYIIELNSKQSMREIMAAKKMRSTDINCHLLLRSNIYFKIKSAGKVSGCFRNGCPNQPEYAPIVSHINCCIFSNIVKYYFSYKTKPALLSRPFENKAVITC